MRLRVRYSVPCFRAAGSAAALVLLGTFAPTASAATPWGIQDCVPAINETGTYLDTCTSGEVNVYQRTSGGFDQWLRPMGPEFSDWLGRHADRAEVFAPDWNARSSQYRSGAFYQHSHSIGIGNAALARYVLKDGPSASAKPLYVNFGCNDGVGCAAYAGDITDPNFRADRVASIKNTFLAGQYRGVWLDDVIMDLTTTDGVKNDPHNPWMGRVVRPWSPTLNRYITDDDWRNAMATLTEDLRRALPRPIEILHNSPWFAARASGGIDHPAVQRQVRAATYIDREDGFNDPGLKGGNGPWSVNALRAWVHGVHKLGAAVVFDDFGRDRRLMEYNIANALAVSTGNDAVGLMDQGPSDWWAGFDLSLGKAKTLRPYLWNGLTRRDFDGGMVLVHDPAEGDPNPAPISQRLPAPMRTVTGAVVTSITVPTSSGVILRTLDGVRRADLVSIGQPGDDTATTIVRNTRRGLARPESAGFYDVPDSQFPLVGDVDGDKIDEVLLVTQNRPGRTGRGWGALVAPRPDGTASGGTRSFPRLGSGSRGLFLADVTGDGRADLLALNNLGAVSVLTNLADDASEDTGDSWAVPAAMAEAATTVMADMNGDAKADLVGWGSDGTVRVALSTGTSFAAPTAWLRSPGFVGRQESLAGDLTGDGRADLVAVNNGSVTIARSAWSLWSGFGLSTPATMTTGSGAGPNEFAGTSFAIKDMDADGIQDLVTIDSVGVRVASSNGSSLARPQPMILPIPFLGTKATLVGEFDNG